MTIFDLPGTPQLVTAELVANTAVSVSFATGSAQTLARGGYRWLMTYTWNNINGDDRGALMGFIATLRGQENRVRLPVFDNPKRGAYGGTPVVNGASQTGSSLVVSGAGSVSNWIRAGDYFSVLVGAEHELKMATADANSSAGAITIPFEPRLRTSPAAGAAIIVDDGTLGRPRGIFMQADNTQGWSSRPGQPSKVSAITIQFIEDIFGTLI